MFTSSPPKKNILFSWWYSIFLCFYFGLFICAFLNSLSYNQVCRKLWTKSDERDRAAVTTCFSLNGAYSFNECSKRPRVFSKESLNHFHPSITIFWKGKISLNIRYYWWLCICSSQLVTFLFLFLNSRPFLNVTAILIYFFILKNWNFQEITIFNFEIFKIVLICISFTNWIHILK